MDNTSFKDLLSRYLDNSLSGDEVKEFIVLLKTKENQDELRETIMQAFLNSSFQGLFDKNRTGILFEEILERASGKGERKSEAQMPVAKVYEGRIGKRTFNFRMPAAAAILVILFASLYYTLLHNKPSKPDFRAEVKSTQIKNDVSPGGNKANLTLGDGSTVSLNDSTSGVIAQQGSSKVLQLNSGLLAYNQIKSLPTQSLYNTVSTQRGGQFQIMLPDGSKVWLNAASSLRFPTVFSGKERNVILTGEAYFEIAANKEMPFNVQVGEMKVEVLGTQFNVMAYDDESKIKTTLLQGAVKVVRGSMDALLQPGQQVGFDKGTANWKIADVDTDEAVAWKNGTFQFHSDDIETIMRQLGRWYDVEIDYAGKIPYGHFSGTISRQTPLSQVLNMLEVNDIHFRTEGRKIIVL